MIAEVRPGWTNGPTDQWGFIKYSCSLAKVWVNHRTKLSSLECSSLHMEDTSIPYVVEEQEQLKVAEAFLAQQVTAVSKEFEKSFGTNWYVTLTV